MSMIMAFWKGTTLGGFGYTGGLDQLRKNSVEMIMSGLKSGDTREELIDLYTGQLNFIEEQLYSLGIVKPENIEKLASQFGMNTGQLGCFWSLNIMALLVLKAIEDNDKYGFVVLDC